MIFGLPTPNWQYSGKQGSWMNPPNEGQAGESWERRRWAKDALKQELGILEEEEETWRELRKYVVWNLL